MEHLDAEQRGTRSLFLAGVMTALCFAICGGLVAAVINAFLTGRTKFPAKWNDTYVTGAENPGWFIASIIALLMMAAVMAWLSMLCGKQLLQLIRDRLSP